MRIMIAALVNNHRRGAQRATVTADGPQNQYAFEYAAVEEEGPPGCCRGDRRQTTHTTFHARDPTSQFSTFISPLCNGREVHIWEPF